VGKLELKKQEYSRLRKRGAGKQGRLPFCTDQGLLPVAERLAELGYPVVTAEDASVNTSDDLAFLAWIREMGLVFVTRDWRRARRVWKDGLLHDRPGIVVIHSPKGDRNDLLEGIDAFLSMRLSYRLMWEVIIYLSHGQRKALFADGSEMNL